jgi:uncharacterized protein (DUF3084 family)
MRRELTAAGESLRKLEQERQALLSQLKEIQGNKRTIEQQYEGLQTESG